MYIEFKVKRHQRELRHSLRNCKEDIKEEVVEDLEDEPEVKLFVTIVDSLNTWPWTINNPHEFTVIIVRLRFT